MKLPPGPPRGPQIKRSDNSHDLLRRRTKRYCCHWAGHAGIEAASGLPPGWGCAPCASPLTWTRWAACPVTPLSSAVGRQGPSGPGADALGARGRAADKACIQYRLLLNGARAPPSGLRAQRTGRRYQEIMKHTLEPRKPFVRQAEVVDILTQDGPGVRGSHPHRSGHTPEGGRHRLGTYGGTDHRGRGGPALRPGGPGRQAPSPRVPDGAGAVHPPLQNGHAPPGATAAAWTSARWSPAGDPEPLPFSFRRRPPGKPGGATSPTPTPKTHEIIGPIWTALPLYDGTISKVGPRYCPLH